MLKGKKIVLGVTGGIAAYKAAELVRELVRSGAEVFVVMTRSSQAFITPLTFQTLSGNKVTTELFSLIEESEIGHISLADRADLLIIARPYSRTSSPSCSGTGRLRQPKPKPRRFAPTPSI